MSARIAAAALVAVALALPVAPLAAGPGPILVAVCGQPGMRIAIPLGGDDPAPAPGDCAKACHAATCRKPQPVRAPHRRRG